MTVQSRRKAGKFSSRNDPDKKAGFTESFVSNETIVAGLTATDVGPLLSNALKWPTYYLNSANVRFYDNKGPELAEGVRFNFETFGFSVEANAMNMCLPKTEDPVVWYGMAGRGKEIRGLTFITHGL